MKVAIVMGTRPEIIKMMPVVRECQRRGDDFFILHTGQHYSYVMDRILFEQLELPEPRYNLDVGSGPQGRQTGKMLAGIEDILRAEKPTDVLVQGDTNTVLAGTLAASKLQIRLGHIEAGLRSFDRTMPEETNRVIADHVSDMLFAPTERNAQLLRREGIPAGRIHVTGNTVVDAVLQNRELARQKGRKVKDLDLTSGGFILMTAHRQENVDDRGRFHGILEGARLVGDDLGLPIIYPIHPRARKMLEQHGLDARGIRLVEPADFLGFLDLEAHARIVLTDSGGVQEEACILGVPCVTLRDNTERPETVDVGANVLAGTDAKIILENARVMASRRGGWQNPIGDGHAAQKILTIIGAN